MSKYTRLTITINDIPIHSTKKESHYTSTRLTVYLFGGVKNLEDYRWLLIHFTEEQLGYEYQDWWDGEKTFVINEAEQEVEPSESKGLGFYRAECAYEDEDGNPTETQLFDAHTSKFGDEIN